MKQKVLLTDCDASSLVIDTLCDWARGRNAAVVCFYFDFAAQKRAISNDRPKLPPKTSCRRTRKDSGKDRRGLPRPEEDLRRAEARTRGSRRDVTGYFVVTTHLHMY